MAPDIELRLDRPQQIFIPLDLQIRMQPALKQNPGPAQINRFLNLVEDNFARKHITFRMPHGPIERAEAAVLRAEIRVVNIPVDDIRDHALRMKLPPQGVRLHPDPDQVVGIEHIDSFSAGHHNLNS